MRIHRTLGIAALAGFCALAGPARAADHAEAPGTRADLAADIADLYAWHDGNTLVAIITFAGLQPPVSGQTLAFDEGVTYTLNIDNDGDFVSDVDVNASFFTSSTGNRGIRVQGLPEGPAEVTGFVGGTINVNGRPQVFSGLVDDPFFFDLQGFRETLSTGTLSFDPTRDSVAGLNATAIALRMPLEGVLGSGSILNIWATTSR